MNKRVLEDCRQRMQKTIDTLQTDLSRIRMGRATPSLLDHITVSYYGADTPINQLANVVVLDPRTLLIKPWEKQLQVEIEKAIMVSDLGLNPASSSDGIRVPLPALTEERRKELTRIIKAEVEQAKVAIRNIRRDANTQFKAFVKDKAMTEDEERRAQDDIQKATNSFVANIDEIYAHKEADIMAV
jgi:ribosome recycling factor